MRAWIRRRSSDLAAVIVLALYVFVIWLMFGCSHPTVAPTPVNAHAIAFDENIQNAGIIDCDKDGCKVTRNWLDKYRQLETEFKQTFPGDANIKPEGEHYRAPYDVVEHFTTMKAAERGGP